MACQKWCLLFRPRAAAEHSHECLGHRGSSGLHCLWWSLLQEASPPFPFVGSTSKASAELQRMPFEVAKSARQLKKTSLALPLQGCSGRCPWWGWLFMVGTKMASFLHKLQMFLSYMNAAPKTSGLATSKDENRSTTLSELF